MKIQAIKNILLALLFSLSVVSCGNVTGTSGDTVTNPAGVDDEVEIGTIVGNPKPSNLVKPTISFVLSETENVGTDVSDEAETSTFTKSKISKGDIAVDHLTPGMLKDPCTLFGSLMGGDAHCASLTSNGYSMGVLAVNFMACTDTTSLSVVCEKDSNGAWPTMQANSFYSGSPVAIDVSDDGGVEFPQDVLSTLEEAVDVGGLELKLSYVGHTFPAYHAIKKSRFKGSNNSGVSEALSGKDFRICIDPSVTDGCGVATAQFGDLLLKSDSGEWGFLVVTGTESYEVSVTRPTDYAFVDTGLDTTYALPGGGYGHLITFDQVRKVGGEEALDITNSLSRLDDILFEDSDDSGSYNPYYDASIHVIPPAIDPSFE